HFKHIHKQWRSPATFKANHTDLPIDPYFLGLWLGDGRSHVGTVQIETEDNVVIDYLHKYAESIDKTISISEQKGSNSNAYRIVNPGGRGSGKKKNTYNGIFRYLNLSNNKHIPNIYKRGTQIERLKLLAGILDADGHYHHGGFDIIQKSEQLLDDIIFIARSLGFSAYKTKCEKTCYNNGVTGTYYRTNINGDTNLIPTKLKRKQADVRNQKKDPLVTGFKIESIGEGDYYGFEIDGPDRLFLLGDFTVTHNTVIFSFIIKRHLQSNAFNRVLVLTHREELFKQSRSKIQTISGKPVAKLKAGMRVGRHHSEASIVVSMIETLKRRDLSKLGEFTLVIVDEAHRNDFLGVLDQLPKSTMVLGFTATPISANKEKPLKNTY